MNPFLSALLNHQLSLCSWNDGHQRETRLAGSWTRSFLLQVKTSLSESLTISLNWNWPYTNTFSLPVCQIQHAWSVALHFKLTVLPLKESVVELVLMRFMQHLIRLWKERPLTNSPHSIIYFDFWTIINVVQWLRLVRVRKKSYYGTLWQWQNLMSLSDFNLLLC